MGNSTSSTRKVVLPNGEVQVFHEPLTVAELMLEHPRHLMVEFNKSLASSKTCLKKCNPLPADTWLDTRNVYLMVPVKKGKVSMEVTFSSKEVNRLVAKATNSSLIKKLKVCTMFPKTLLPYILASGKMCSFMTKDCAEECLLKMTNVQGDTEIWEEVPEYCCRKVSGKGWRPSLETIIEKNVKKKVSHWLY